MSPKNPPYGGRNTPRLRTLAEFDHYYENEYVSYTEKSAIEPRDLFHRLNIKVYGYGVKQQDHCNLCGFDPIGETCPNCLKSLRSLQRTNPAIIKGMYGKLMQMGAHAKADYLKQYIPMTAGEILKRFRKSLRMTQDAFGEIVGATQSMVAQVENDNRPVPRRWKRTLKQIYKRDYPSELG